MKITFTKGGGGVGINEKSLLFKIVFVSDIYISINFIDIKMHGTTLKVVSDILPNTMAYSMLGKDKGCLHNISLEI